MKVLIKVRNITGLLLLCLILGCNNSKVKKQKITVNNDTHINFEKSVHTFGEIKEGEIVGCYFNFTNSGEYPLVINGVKSACGCTTVKYPKEPILPGKKGEVEVRFDARGFSGHQYKVIQVHANIENKMKELVVSANVIN